MSSKDDDELNLIDNRDNEDKVKDLLIQVSKERIQVVKSNKQVKFWLFVDLAFNIVVLGFLAYIAFIR